jgi:hypothetical protein
VLINASHGRQWSTTRHRQGCLLLLASQRSQLSSGRSARVSTHSAADCGRLARADARDCVFFMHGVLDTSMGWVSNGITGSQAFAAYDQGFDVWLGNSRANPPRDHIGA